MTDPRVPAALEDLGPELVPQRAVDDLKHLRDLTSDARGAQRVAFTPPWQRARTFLQEQLAGLPVEIHTDAAANLWITLQGRLPRAVVIGGHLDSVPDGGWLDGSLNVLAGLEVLRWVHAHYPEGPPVTVKLVDWADEEGARFGRSLFGSSAAAGTLDLAGLADLQDAAGMRLGEVLAQLGLELGSVLGAQDELQDMAAYLELHIEQGPVLEHLHMPLATVSGTMGVNRFILTFIGQAAHSGTTPMHLRRDAFLAAADFTREIYRHSEDGASVCTVGRVVTRPGVVNCVVETCELTLEQRCLDVDTLKWLADEVAVVAQQVAIQQRCSVQVQPLWQIDPVPFDEQMIQLCEEALEGVGVPVHRMPSGAIHDASSMARRGIPTGMLFVRSRGGLSHTPLEDTDEADLLLSVRALAGLTRHAIHRVLSQDA